LIIYIELINLKIVSEVINNKIKKNKKPKGIRVDNVVIDSFIRKIVEYAQCNDIKIFR